MKTKKEMKAEAVKRMKMMNILPETIEQFEKEDIVTASEYVGALYWVEGERKKMIEDFEREYGALVFHCILSNTDFGSLFSMLFVSKYDEEWEYDIDDIKNGRHIAMVKNLDDDWCSDMGTIGFRNQWGGLVRTW